ncbi:TPA: hypothetical protein ACF9DN_002806 [Staphylococcus aureus]|uniref:hypothetical protein n=1 Tax=Staphylococcus saprophyticus TaxID=29385 RepID=UPI00298B7808|nr:hypothetical protein [Staphylococcus aureus]HDH6438668.1 hypothetical protein [Staphylococcus aureus MRSA-Lux-28]HDF0017415.1 hypothetical protein [Staphylococcus aureus]HDF0281803.1 hypothetical protein [Staphylococcus aureus]HDH5902277.1 hypothetical protein [Staphylococcus aureus]
MGWILLLILAIGSGVYHFNHKYVLEKAIEFTERKNNDLDKDIQIQNINHIIKDEKGELKFVFNSNTFREIYPDELNIVNHDNNMEIEIIHSLKYRDYNLKKMKVKQLSNISANDIKEDSIIKINVTKEFINQYLI